MAGRIPWMFVAIVIALAGCDSTKFDSATVYLRVQNASTTDFSSVLVDTGGSANYGAVSAGHYSEYRSMEIAYRYGYVKAEVDDSEFVLQPIDYVGEVPLTPGKYTYRLTIVDDHLALELLMD